jgi:diguanylate cyclase (GGDEF)-like protein
MVVEDATEDPRFHANPLVTGGPRIRFYAGAPILAEDQQALGTLAVIDRVPRKLSAAQTQHLADLAAGIAAMLDLYREPVPVAWLATHDVLTGLLNRSAFEQRLEEAVAGALAGRPCGMVQIDVDGLRDVNDGHGHDIGDAVLRAVADRLKATVRTGDLVARLGGDEFAILMPGPVDAETATGLAARVVETLRTPLVVDGEAITFAASAGISLCPVDATEAAALMRHAQEGLYQAKRGGGGRFARSGGETAALAVSSPALGDELRAALRCDELTLVWQPYFEVASGRVLGFEALARWDRRPGGAIGPGVFVPVAEAAGLSGPFDAWVLTSACHAALQWPGALKVAINLSAHWFSDGEAVALVEAALARCGLGPERLVLEMTERTLVTHARTAFVQMTKLRAMGVGIALDDFGVGFSSLATLRDFPFNKVKLDRAFTKDLVIDPRADAVARAVLQLGRGLGMEVCAEGVETEEQLAFLRAERCDAVQGYLLGRPCPSPQFAQPDQFLTARTPGLILA